MCLSVFALMYFLYYRVVLYQCDIDDKRPNKHIGYMRNVKTFQAYIQSVPYHVQILTVPN